MKKILLIVIPILLITVPLILFWGGTGKSATGVRWREFEVKRSDLAETVEASGFIQPREEVQIFSEIEGEVLKIYVGVGEPVKKGQTLLLIDASTLLNQLDQAEAGVRQAQITLDNAKTDWERMTRLEKEQIVSRQQLESSEVKYLAAVESLKIAEFKKAQLLKNVDPSRISTANNQSYYTLSAPIDGVILSVNAKVGSKKSYSSGQVELPLIAMADVTKLIAEFDIDESDISKVSSGQPVTLIHSASEQEFQSQIAVVSSQGINSNGVVIYQATTNLIENSKFLKPGMTIDTRIWLSRKEAVLTLPSAAIVNRNGRKMVRIMDGQEPRYQRVEVGMDDGELAEILSGLNEGDKVVVETVTQTANKSAAPNGLPGLTPSIRGVR